MADKLVPILTLRWRPHQAPLKGSVTGSLYHFERKGHGICLCLVDERDVQDIILKNPDYRLATLAEHLRFLR